MSRKPPLVLDGIYRDFEAARSRLASLGERLPSAPSPVSPLLHQGLRELGRAAEELLVADEKLRRQNEELVRTNQLLQQERRRYADFFTGSPDANLVTDLVGTIREANPAAGRLFGVPPKYLLHKLLANYVVKDERRGFRARVEDLGRTWREGEGAGQWECRIRSKAGDTVAVSVTVRVMLATEGQSASLQWVLRDTPERERAEERLRIAAGCATDLIYEWDFTNDRVEWFGDIDQKLGYLPHEFPRSLEAWRRIVHPDDRQKGPASEHLQHTGEEPLTLRYRVLRKNGEVLHWLDRGAPLVDEKGQPFKWIGAITDVSDARQAQEEREQLLGALKESNARLQSLSDANIIGIVVANPERVVEANDAFLRIIGYTRADLAAGLLSWDRLTPREYAERDAAGLDELIRSGSCAPYEKAYVRRDGKRAPVLVGGVVVWREPLEWIGFALDIREQKRSEQALRESEARFRRVVESNMLGIVFANTKTGKVHDANDAYLNLLGVTREELEAGTLNWIDFTPPEYLEQERRIAEESARFGWTRQPYEKEYIRRDGTRVPAMVGGARLAPKSDEGVAFVLDLTERKRAEQALRDSEERFRVMAQTVPEIVYTANASAEADYFNPRFVEYTGMSPEGVRGRGWEAAVHPQDIETLREKWRQAVATGQPLEHEFRLRRADSTYRWFVTRASRIGGPGGEEKWVGTSTDINDLKVIAAALRQSEERLELALESAMMAWWDWEIETGKVTYSDRLPLLLGLPPLSRLTYEGMIRGIHPDDQQALRDSITRTIKEGTRYDIEVRAIWPDASIHWLAVLGQVSRDSQGRAVRVTGLNWDITTRKEAEEALRAGEARERARIAELEAIMETLPTPVWVAHDPKCAVITGNRASYELVGRRPAGGDSLASPPGAPGPYEVRIAGAKVTTSELPIQRAVATARPVLGAQLEFVYADGEVRTLYGNAAPVFDETGKVRGGVGAFVDLTQRIRAEQALQRLNESLERRVAERTAAAELRAMELARSNAELEQFAYIASHDLQEPLRMVTNFTQLLEQRYRGRLGRDADEFIGYAVEGVDRMHALITGLLAYARVGQKAGENVSVDLGETCARALNNLTTVIRDTGAIVTCEHLPTIQADSFQMLQLFQNLIGNALKFRRPHTGPRVRIWAERLDPEPDRWRISVEDNGIGIAKEHADKVFVIFQRLHARGEYDGTGIGLAICKKIVERVGGRIWVESTPGGGSVFRFTVRG